MSDNVSSRGAPDGGLMHFCDLSEFCCLTERITSGVAVYLIVPEGES